MTAQGAETRESDFVFVIPSIALQNMFPVNFSSRALFKQIATSCGGFFVVGWLVGLVFFFPQKSIQSRFIKTVF